MKENGGYIVIQTRVGTVQARIWKEVVLIVSIKMARLVNIKWRKCRLVRISNRLD
jgi:hypothetical protein